MLKDDLLTFGEGNAKLTERIHTFSLPSGWTCPAALDCKAMADPESGKIIDGPETKFRCFSATTEALYPSVRDSRWRNFNLLVAARTSDAMATLINASIPRRATIVRVHVGGDFFSRAYLDAWHTVANSRPDVLFYCYTKSVHFLPPRSELAPNLRVTVSAGTRHDLAMARTLGYPVAFVVFAPGGPLPIDHDDSHAIAGDHDFALLLHGTQPAGSDAAVALRALRSQGHTGYRKGA